MSDFKVLRKSDGEEVLRYSADTAQTINGFDLVDYDHVEFVPDEPVPTPVNPANWKIDVGSFFDRFGASRLAILSSQDPLIQAVIKDASVRKCIDLIGRRDDLLQVIGLLNSKGFAIDPVTVLDLEPTVDEVWNGQ